MNQRRNAVTKQQPHEQVVAEPRHGAEAANERDFVRAFIVKLTSDPALADDITQETFLRAHKSESQFKGDAARSSWLCAIALNVVRDHFRAAARQPTRVSDAELLLALQNDDILEDNVQQDEMDSCIRRYVLRLPEHQRDVVALHDIAGFTHGEVASALGLSEGNSRVMLHRGRAALKLLLEENCDLSFGESVPCQRKSTR